MEVTTFAARRSSCPGTVNQTRGHKPYGELNPIASPPIPFHTITLDFIVGLPKANDGSNAVLTVTDKFTKRVTLIPGQENSSLLVPIYRNLQAPFAYWPYVVECKPQIFWSALPGSPLET